MDTPWIDCLATLVIRIDLLTEKLIVESCQIINENDKMLYFSQLLNPNYVKPGHNAVQVLKIPN